MKLSGLHKNPVEVRIKPVCPDADEISPIQVEALVESN